MSETEAPRPSQIVIEFSPDHPMDPRITMTNVQLLQVAWAAWQLDQVARRWFDQVAPPQPIGGLVVPQLQAIPGLADVLRRAGKAGG